MNQLSKWMIVFATLLCFSSARAADIIVKMPEGTVIKDARAKPWKMKLTTTGKVDGATVRFTNLLPDTRYAVTLTLADGTVLQGVNMGWYDMEPPNPNAAAINDDDKQQITAILKQVLSFFNKNDIVLLHGNHDRATVLVQLVRDKSFHSDKGDEVIWRMELWYYKNEHGGWAKVQQAAEMIRRERFASHGQYHEVIDHLRWTPELGGLKVAKNGPDLTITLPATAGTLGKSTP